MLVLFVLLLLLIKTLFFSVLKLVSSSGYILWNFEMLLFKLCLFSFCMWWGTDIHNYMKPQCQSVKQFATIRSPNLLFSSTVSFSGKAVFSEKPIGETPEDTKVCYMTAEKVNRPLFCGFQRRFDPTFSDIQSRVRKGGHTLFLVLLKIIIRDGYFWGKVTNFNQTRKHCFLASYWSKVMTSPQNAFLYW